MRIVLSILLTLFIVPSTVVASIDSGIVSYYPFTGNANDESGNGNHATVNGAILTSDRNSQSNNAYQFDGIDDYLEANVTSLPIGNTPRTIDLWFKKNPSSNFSPALFGYGAGTAANDATYVVIINHKLCIGRYGGGDTCGTTTLMDGEWHHATLTYDIANKMKLYLDGNIEASRSEDYATTISALRIGVIQNFFNDAAFTGNIDDIRIYDRALSDYEVHELHTSSINQPPVAVAGTSLDGNSLLQLDGSLSSDPNSDVLTYTWNITGEATPRLGKIISISDLSVGSYTVTLQADDGKGGIDSDTMLLGIPVSSGTTPTPTSNELLQSVIDLKGMILSFATSSFSAPNDKARENRRKSILNMLDKIYEAIEITDYQAAVDQLRDIQAKVDGSSPPASTNDWINGVDTDTSHFGVSDLITNLLLVCGTCS